MNSEKEVNYQNMTSDLMEIMMSVHKNILNPSSLAKMAGISYAQLGIMFFLLKIENPSVTELAAHLRISKPNMTPLLDSLIEMGYITRERDPHDRRVLRISVTDEGKKFYGELRKYNCDMLKSATISLSDEELEKLSFYSSELLKLLKKAKERNIRGEK